jgi:amino acid adenylation domain-containing protein
MQVERFLEESAARDPGKTALVCGGRRWSYAGIDARANRLAHSLRRAGVARGDRVVVYRENGMEAVVAVFAILKAGAVFVVVNPSTKAGKLAYILNNSRASAVVTDRGRGPAIVEMQEQLPHLAGVWREGEADNGEGRLRVYSLDAVLEAEDGSQAPGNRNIDMDIAALIYTSGSTGRPKGVVMTHLNIVSAATSITTYLESRPADIVLCALPLAFDYGLYQVLMTFKVGGTVVLERSFTYPHEVLRVMEREGVTGFPLVPTMAAILLRSEVGGYRLPALRYISNTGAALPAAHIKELRKLWPHARIYSMYGLTECKRVSYLPPDQIDIRPDSVGRGMPNEEVYLVDENGRRLGAGEVGELVVRGSNVMQGYWELPEETAKVLRPGRHPWEKVLYTGDLFRMDEEGFLYFVGRRDDIIKTRGEKVSPKEVEEVLCRLPGVSQAAVVGMADEVLGQAIKAVITLRPGAVVTAQDVLSHCARNLEDYMVPKQVVFQDWMPQTDSGKVSKRELAASAAGGAS